MNKGFFSEFWRLIFPINDFKDFLTCFGEYPLEYREFVFNFGDIYKRYNNGDSSKPIRFKTLDDLHDYLIDKNVTSFLCGPIWFPHATKDDKYSLLPAPLFFDIDLDDYHDPKKTDRPADFPRIIRTCPCEPRTCCDVCWIQIARKPLIYMIDFLTNIMEYKYLIPFYSGSRGFWIIVWDKQVWCYDRMTRENIVDQMSKHVLIDRGVSVQPTHLMKLPLTPHKKSRILTTPIDDPETFVPSIAPHFEETNKEMLKKWSELYLKK